MVVELARQSNTKSQIFATNDVPSIYLILLLKIKWQDVSKDDE